MIGNDRSRAILLAAVLIAIGAQLPAAAQQTAHDIVVIGGGLMGSSAAWQLARAGEKVLLLERQGRDYTFGSSQGESRIARSNNRGADIWSYLHNRAVAEASELVEELRTAGIKPEPGLDDLYRTSPVSYVHRTEIAEALVESLVRQGVEYQLALDPQQARQLFAADLPPGILLMREYNEHSGTLNPQQLIRYLHRAIEMHGGELRFNSRVTRLIGDGDEFRIDIAGEATETLRAQRLISAAGPYTGQLLADLAPAIDRLITPERVFLAFLRPRRDAWARLSAEERQRLLDGYPVINSSAGNRFGSYFAMIERFEENGRPILKIGGHFQRSPVDAIDDVWTQELSRDEVEFGVANTTSYLRLLGLPLTREDVEYTGGYSCIYSLTGPRSPT